MKYHFASKFRNADFEGLPGVAFKDFRFSTDDEEIAATLRTKANVTEITAAVKTTEAPSPEAAPPEQVAALAETEQRVEQVVPKLQGGMRRYQHKEKKPR